MTRSNLADKLARIWRKEGDESLLDLYERQRRHIACSTPRPRPSATRSCSPRKTRRCAGRNHDELRRQSEDPKLARAFLLRTSLIDSVREAARIA